MSGGPVRKGSPVLLAEQFAMAGWLRDGEPVSRIAQRSRRTVRETRAILFGDGQ